MLEGDPPRIWVGVLRIEVLVPGARSLKDRRQTVRSVRDRMRSRFEVTVHEVGTGSDPGRQTLVITTAGNDAAPIRSVLDRCGDLVRRHAVASVGRVDVDVFRWHPPEDRWAARMMEELGEENDLG